jgi:flagellar motor switch protein FliN/FliY
MNGGSLSQEEIDALLKDGDAAAGAPTDEAAAPQEPLAEQPLADEPMDDEPMDDEPVAGDPLPEEPVATGPDVELTDSERDTIGEVGNICMSSAATTLSTLLGRPVQITTPTVDLVGEAEVRGEFDLPAVVVTIEHTEGLDGRNLFILTTRDASVVADLMMGGEGAPLEELSDLHTSAIAEAMNQMTGSAATAMAEMAGRRVDISSPVVEILDLRDDASAASLGLDPSMVRTSFQLRVGDLLDTRLMQLMPVPFARALVDGLLAVAPASEGPPATPPPAALSADDQERHLHALPASPVAQPVAFPSLDEVPAAPGGSDISLLLDVPLQVTVELGRTQLRIRNVLELVPGSIVELDKLAGEPVDVLVNGKQIARGEVVVIDEEFGVRITDVASQAKRLRGLAAEEG